MEGEGGPTGGKDMRDELIGNGAPNLTRCIQCGTCTAGCTVFELDKAYNPRRIIQTFLVGETPVEMRKAWLCSTCGVCTERCPKDVWPMNVMLSARGLMVRSRPPKGVPKDRLRSLASISRSGFAFSKKGGLMARRSTLKLPEFGLDKAELEQVRKLLMPSFGKRVARKSVER